MNPHAFVACSLFCCLQTQVFTELHAEARWAEGKDEHDRNRDMPTPELLGHVVTSQPRRGKVRAAPLVRVRLTSAVYESLRQQHTALDSEFDFDSHEWSCSQVDPSHTNDVAVMGRIITIFR